jgi:hypothetical protein
MFSVTAPLRAPGRRRRTRAEIQLGIVSARLIESVEQHIAGAQYLI